MGAQVALSAVNQNRASRSAGEAKHGPRKPDTGWLAWSLQLLLGLVVGTGVGFSFARLLFRSGFNSFGQMFYVAAGVALGCGAFASFYGDRAWMGQSLWDWPEPCRTQTHRTCSIIIGSLGAALVLLPMALHLATGDASTGERSSGRFSLFSLILAAVPGCLLIHALRTGTGFWRFGSLDREETPLFYWIYVVVMALGVICLLFGR